MRLHDTKLTARNFLISDCEATYGGALSLFLLDGHSSITDSQITGNFGATSGGGIEITSTPSLELRRIDLRSNTAGEYGGGISCDGRSAVSLSNLILAGNVCREYGGGMHLDCAFEAGFLTFVGNEAENGGGLSYSGSEASLKHSTFSQNRAFGDDATAFLIDPLQQVDWSFNHAYNNSPNDSTDLPFDYSGDPLFVSTTGDPTTWDLHLQGGSPIVNVGGSARDTDGTPADIGAYGGPDAW